MRRRLWLWLGPGVAGLALALAPGALGATVAGGCAGISTQTGTYCLRFQAAAVPSTFDGRYRFADASSLWRLLPAPLPSAVFSGALNAQGLQLIADKSSTAALSDNDTAAYRLAIPSQLQLVGVTSNIKRLLNDRAGQLPSVLLLKAAAAPATTDGGDFFAAASWDKDSPGPPPNVLDPGDTTAQPARPGTPLDNVVSTLSAGGGPASGAAVQYRLRTTCGTSGGQGCPVTFASGENAEMSVERADVLLFDPTPPTVNITAAATAAGSCPRITSQQGATGSLASPAAPDPAVTWMKTALCVRVSTTIQDGQSGVATVAPDNGFGADFPKASVRQPDCNAAADAAHFGRECPASLSDSTNVHPPRNGGTKSFKLSATDQGGQSSGTKTLHLYWDPEAPKLTPSPAPPTKGWIKNGDNVSVGVNASDRLSGVMRAAAGDAVATATCAPTVSNATDVCRKLAATTKLHFGGDDGDASTVDVKAQPKEGKRTVVLSATDVAGNKATRNVVLDHIDFIDPKIVMRKPLVYAKTNDQQIPIGPVSVNVTFDALADKESGLAKVEPDLLTRAGERIGYSKLDPNKVAGSPTLRINVSKREAFRTGRVRITATDKAGNQSVLERPFDVNSKTKRPAPKKPRTRKPKITPVPPAATNTKVAYGISLGDPENYSTGSYPPVPVNEAQRARIKEFFVDQLRPRLAAINAHTGGAGHVLVRYIAPVDSLAQLAPDGSLAPGGDSRLPARLDAFADALRSYDAPGLTIQGMISFAGHDFLPDSEKSPSPCHRVSGTPESGVHIQEDSLPQEPPPPLASCSVPSAALYARYVRQFLEWNAGAAGGRVVAWGPWNEPDNAMFKFPNLLGADDRTAVDTATSMLAGYVTTARAQLQAAQTERDAMSGPTAVANAAVGNNLVLGEFSDFSPDDSAGAVSRVGGVGTKRRRQTFQAGSPGQGGPAATAGIGSPKTVAALAVAREGKSDVVWGIHNYGDWSPPKSGGPKSRTAEDYAATLRQLGQLGAGASASELWLSETGVPYSFGHVDGKPKLEYQAGALLSNAGRRIPELRRVLLYQVLQAHTPPAGGKPAFDSAWLERSGLPRYSWCGFVKGAGLPDSFVVTESKLTADCGQCAGASTSASIPDPTTPYPPLPPTTCPKR